MSIEFHPQSEQQVAIKNCIPEEEMKQCSVVRCLTWQNTTNSLLHKVPVPDSSLEIGFSSIWADERLLMSEHISLWSRRTSDGKIYENQADIVKATVLTINLYICTSWSRIFKIPSRFENFRIRWWKLDFRSMTPANPTSFASRLISYSKTTCNHKIWMTRESGDHRLGSARLGSKPSRSSRVSRIVNVSEN